MQSKRKWRRGGNWSKLDFQLSDHGSASQTFYKAHSEDNLPFKKIYVLTCKYGHNIVK